MPYEHNVIEIMQVKATNPIELLHNRHTLPLIEAYFEFTQLKQLYRQGWLLRGVSPERCESVAEHTFGMAVLSLFIASAYFPELDLLKVLRMALLHDFGEIYAGDIVPADHVSATEKHAREQASAAQVFSHLPNGNDYLALWQEYEESATAEARFVKQMDRLEMALQASVYEQQGIVDASEFLASAQASMSAPELQAIMAEIMALRKA